MFWNLFFSSILLPLVAIALLYRTAFRPLSAWIATLLMAAGLVGFSVLAAPWGWFGLWVRYAIAVLFVVALVRSLLRKGEAAEPRPASMVMKALIGFFFGGVAIGVMRGHAVPPHPIALHLPLRGGTYLVAHGGSSAPSNIHFQDAKQRYAVDFVKLGAYGMRAHGIYPKDPRAFAIFGANVLSPCDGVVADTLDGMRDDLIDPKNPLGNRVSIRCGDATIVLAQLQRGSIAVKRGANVASGTVIGRVGNSGASPEPHLHVHAEREGIAAPMLFDGQWLVRNDTVR